MKQNKSGVASWAPQGSTFPLETEQLKTIQFPNLEHRQNVDHSEAGTWSFSTVASAGVKLPYNYNSPDETNDRCTMVKWYTSMMSKAGHILQLELMLSDHFRMIPINLNNNVGSLCISISGLDIRQKSCFDWGIRKFWEVANPRQIKKLKRS